MGGSPMPELRLRRLGRTGLLVRELGFGAANVATAPEGEEALVRAFALGVNFVETGRMYRGSEYMIGGALGQLPDRGASVHVASKTIGRSRDAALRDLERSLDHLGLRGVDIYQLADVRRHDWEQVMGPGGALEGLREAQDRGLVRYVGISSHSHQMLRQAIESGEFDTVQLKYSVFNLRHEELIRLAHQKDIGVIVMKALGGFGMAGALKSSRYWERLNAKTLLRYVLSNRYLSVAIPGMRFPWEVEENVALALTYKPVTPPERARLREEAEAYLTESAAPTAPAGDRPGALPV
jgi:aryl-alcohol dehydrogenase-like predicted oxidoreductase